MQLRCPLAPFVTISQRPFQTKPDDFLAVKRESVVGCNAAVTPAEGVMGVMGVVFKFRRFHFCNKTATVGTKELSRNSSG